MKEIIERFTPRDYVAVLPTTSRTIIDPLVEAGVDPLELAGKLALEPGEGLATKSGETWPRDLLPRLIREVHIFVCGDDAKYREQRQELKAEAAISANAIVFIVSNAVAIHAGMAVALCVPLVALILASIAKISIAAWCKAVVPQS